MSANVVAGMAVEISGDGTPVICIHGLGGTSNTYTPQMPALAARRTIRPDLPCSGRSANVDRPSIGSFANAIAKLADMLGVKSAHFVGHSLGTIICQHLAAERLRAGAQPHADRCIDRTGPAGARRPAPARRMPLDPAA